MTGRIAIVTGGTTGIGLATTRALIASGHRVAIGARGAADPALQANLKRQLGEDVMVAGLDVASRASVDGFVAQVQDTLGLPTILVNAAGIYREAYLADHEEADWSDQIGINLTGAFRMTRAVFAGMQAANWGRIANIASHIVHRRHYTAAQSKRAKRESETMKKNAPVHRASVAA